MNHFILIFSSIVFLESCQTCHSSSFSSSTTSSTKFLPNSYIAHSKDALLISTMGLRGGSANSSRKGESIIRNNMYKTISKTDTDTHKRINHQAPNTDNNNHDLPTIEAILIPKQISMPRMVRLLSAVLFTSSFLECCRTSGVPFANAVTHTLLTHGIKPQYYNELDLKQQHRQLSSSSWKQVSSFDIYMAQKIASSSSNTISIPPSFLPQPIPFIGLMLSMFLYFGVTLLFPFWFIKFETWLNYRRVDVITKTNDLDDSGLNLKQRYAISIQKMNEIQSYLLRDDEGSNIDGDDDFYQSQFLNRSNDKSFTGLAVLVHLSKYDQEMGEEDGKSHVIRRLYYEGIDNDNHCDEGGILNQQYYIEMNQRRIYVELDLNHVINEEKPNHGYYIIRTKCRDDSPTFYKSESLQQLHSRSYDGIIHSSLSKLNSKNPKSVLQSLQRYQSRYEKYNKLILPIPTVQKAFVSRISTPLSVMQFVGKLLSIVEDDSLAPSVFNILSTLGRHYWSATKSIVSAKELATEIQGNIEGDIEEQMYWTLRPKVISRRKKKKGTRTIPCDTNENKMEEDIMKNKWELIPSSKILPGDVFCFPPDNVQGGTKQKKDIVKTGTIMPVDALLLEGSCVALEAVITGESVPQAKVALDIGEPEKKLCLDTIHRSSALFAGTSVMQCTNESDLSKSGKNYIKLPKKYVNGMLASIQPIKCLAIRTGSYSSKGEIVRALSKSKKHTGSITTPQSERDSIKLISVLATFACVACVTLFIPSLMQGSEAKKVTTFRRIIQCTRIAVASIPSDLPLALSYVAQSCSTQLRRDADVVCSEPGALLTASQVNMVVFDKTGTLTSDTQRLKMIVPLPSKESQNNRQCHYMTDVVLAGCHSLVSINNNDKGKSKLVGDPLDIASLEFSEWTFDSKSKCASAKLNDNTTETYVTKRLWQLKTFPFDATRRRSSALVLLLHDDNISLWKLIKGSPDSMGSLIENNLELGKEDYMDTVEELGSKGLRVITMAAKNVSNDESLVNALFPEGLPTISTKDEMIPKNLLSYARNVAQDSLSINDIEETLSGFFDFVGFSCFDTVIRPSTKRIVCDLKKAGANVCMLTGDAPEAAFTVANKCGFYSKQCGRKKYLLDIDGQNHLNLTVTLEKEVPKRSVKFCFQSVKNILKDSEMGKCALVVTGRAFDYILQRVSDETINDELIACMYFMKNLNQISVISRSSPSTKQRVISAFKEYSGMNVMMCGDGVNDIAAMKTADTSAALLTGFGKEIIVANSIDVENERRKSRLLQKPIGGNRMKVTRSTKQFLSRDDKLALAKGGAAAARILAQDDKLRKSVASKAATTSKIDEDIDDIQIKPGEASLAAPFTFLRPCVDGAEAVIRSGIATSAFSLSCHRSIALNSLMACFNLATLYRHGFRYGKYMWNVELSLMMAMDQGQHQISCTPRPKVSGIRPNQSIFHPSSALSILLQSICHLYILSYGHYAATVIEKKYGESFKNGVTIRLITPELFGPLGKLFKSQTISKDGKTGIFGKKRFIPNHITNTVFILSCFQNTVISLVNHMGSPFNGSILESRSFCFWIGVSMIFCVVAATESHASLNEMLQLAPMPSKWTKGLLLSLMICDVVVSVIIDKLCIYFLDRERWDASTAPDGIQKDLDNAANLEEQLLCEERNMNKSMLLVFASIGIWLTLQHVVL